MADGIHITELPEATAADDNSYLAVANGNLTKKIKVGTFNETANGTARAYAEAAEAQAATASTKAGEASTSASEAALSLAQIGTLAGQVDELKSQAAASASAAQQSAADAAAEIVTMQTLVAEAEGYVNQIATSAALSQSYAVGGTGTRTGEDTDNAAYYAQQAAGAVAGGVTSFNGRSGAITPRLGDYSADTVGYETVSGSIKTVKQKIQEVEDELSPMTGASASVAGSSGLVPAPAAGDQNKALLGNGTWGDVIPADMTGASASAAGTHGLVPAPAAGNQDKFLRGDGTWHGATQTMTGASASAAGTSGYVPAPAAGAQNNFLRADGSWQNVQWMIDASVSCAKITVPNTGWSQVTVDGGTYYANEVTVTSVKDEHPDVFIAPGGSNTFPTSAQSAAFNKLTQVIAGTNKLTFYASAAPSDTFYVYARGVQA